MSQKKNESITGFNTDDDYDSDTDDDYDSDTDDDYDSDTDVIQIALAASYNHYCFQLTGSYPKKKKRKIGISAKNRKNPSNAVTHASVRGTCESINKKGLWSVSEHELFLQALKQYPKQWNKIAEIVQTRTPAQVRSHAQKYFNKLQRKASQQGNLADPQKSTRSKGTRSTAKLNKRKASQQGNQGNSENPQKRARSSANTDAAVFTTVEVVRGDKIQCPFKLDGKLKWMTGTVGKKNKTENWYSVRFEDDERLIILLTSETYRKHWIKAMDAPPQTSHSLLF